MLVRTPTFELSHSPTQWGDNAEAVAFVNGVGIIPAAVERYLIRVLRQAKKLLDPVADADLIRDVDLFNRQEGQHLKAHAEYLLWLRDNGYPRITEFEAAFEADLQEFLASKPLDWNLSYCEGFESAGLASSYAWVDGLVAELCGDHGSAPMQMWMWHNAEEFEHRCVVHDVMERIYGPERAFELRVQGADFERPHMRAHSAAAQQYVLEVVREGMTPDEHLASVERENAMLSALADATLANMLWVYEADYSPAHVPVPRDCAAILDRYTQAA
jgi:hypothetical protein